MALQADGYAGRVPVPVRRGTRSVGIWEKVWARNKSRKHVLEYDVLVAPHHLQLALALLGQLVRIRRGRRGQRGCRDALGQARSGAEVLASSKPIKDDDIDPPCIRAKREYKAIVAPHGGTFTCIADRSGTDPYEIEVTYAGHKPKRPTVPAAVAVATGIGAAPLPHG